MKLYQSTFQIISEAAYFMDVPKTEHSCGHLLEKDLLEDISKRKVRPINPHAQRLLAAQVREANPAKAKGKPKATPNAAAKDKSASGEDHDEGAEPPTKKVKKPPDCGNEPSPTRTEYSQAKKSFFDQILSSTGAASFCGYVR